MSLYRQFGQALPFVLALLLFTQPVYAQQIDNVDEAFREARELATNGNYSEAGEWLRAVLDIAPDYHEVRAYLARVYGWEQRFGPARSELKTILSRDPGNIDAYITLMDIETWDGQPREALHVSRQAMALHPENERLRLKRAELHLVLGQYLQASDELKTLLESNPDHPEAVDLKSRLDRNWKRNILAAAFTYDHYSDDFKPWSKAYIEVHRHTRRGPLIGRINAANRFDITDYQFEVDAYPKFHEKWYAYLNTGFSGGDLLPDFRAGAELYHSFSDSWEISGGFRYLDFGTEYVWIFTGNLSKYWRNWFFSARPYLTPRDENISSSISIIARRYLDGPETYFSINSGFGFSPDERRLAEVPDEIRFLTSQFVGMDVYRLLGSNFQVFGEIRFTRQDPGIPGGHIQIFTFEIGSRFKF